jgi:hypothetical protein
MKRVKAMYGLLENLLTAIGGGVVVLIGVLTIFKQLIIKLYETGIESSFEKKLVKFKSELERSTRAYEIILDREMRFYQGLEPIIAEIIPLEHDLKACLEYDKDADKQTQYETLKSKFKRHCELYIELKNLILVHHTYIPVEIYHAFTDVDVQMGDDISLWHDMVMSFYKKEYTKIAYKKTEDLVEELLKKIAIANSLVRDRLRNLIGDNN